jgi:hypothetical protein
MISRVKSIIVGAAALCLATTLCVTSGSSQRSPHGS